MCRSVTNSPVIGPCSALKFPLAIYKDKPIKPKSFPQISTNFLLSTFEFNSFFSSVFARLCELCQKRTLKDPFLKPLNVLLIICFETTIECCSFDMKRPQIQRHRPFVVIVRLSNKFLVCCGSLVNGLSFLLPKGLNFVQLLSKSLKVLLKNAKHKITNKLKAVTHPPPPNACII